MPAMHDHPEDRIQHLARSRARADRRYNDALTALDAVVLGRPEMPDTVVPPCFDDRQMQALNETWHLLPDETLDFGTGCRSRLRGFIWRLIGPSL